VTVGDVIANFERVESNFASGSRLQPTRKGPGLSTGIVDNKEFRLTVDVDENDERFWKYAD